MSTAELFLEPDEVEDFVRETAAGSGIYLIGEDGREIGICPYLTFYIYNTPEQFVELCMKVVDIFKEFESQIINEPFQLIWRDAKQDWLPPGDPSLPSDQMPDVLRAQSDAAYFAVRATDMPTTAQTARWAFNAWMNDGIGSRYTEVKLTFRRRWYAANQDKWHAFVERCLTILQPDHCYSGFEVGNGGFNTLGAYECDVLERISADYFYGMDIDHPDAMSFHNFNDEEGYSRDVILGAGIRTPTWCFMLSPYWQARLGKTEAQIRAELNDPRIQITAVPYTANKIYPQGGNGLWIRLGDLELYPVDQGVPDLLVKANRLIRPIRCDELHLLTLDPWDDDPNPRFDYVDSLRWMRRFDDDSDWPDPQRRGFPPAGTEGGRRALPGEPAPRAGWWRTVALPAEEARVHVALGQIMPGPERSELGRVIWHYDADQA